MLRVFVGLGNPGPAYRSTRHNAGFMVIDSVASKLGVVLRRPLFRGYELVRSKIRTGAAVTLVKPQTYMNRSGEVLPAILRRAKADPAATVVVCDQLDLPPGSVRIKRGGSNAGHGGLKSVGHCLGDDGFVRVYIGIGKPATRAQVVEHVLGAPEGADLERFRAGISLGAAALLRLFDSPLEEVMNEFNQRGKPAQ